jgi:hypothetical protein
MPRKFKGIVRLANIIAENKYKITKYFIRFRTTNQNRHLSSIRNKNYKFSKRMVSNTSTSAIKTITINKALAN